MYQLQISWQKILGHLLSSMRPHREEQMEIRVVAVRNGKRKTVKESRKQNKKWRMGITKQQVLEKGQWKQINSQGKYGCFLFLQIHWSFAEQIPQEKAAVMNIVHVVPCSMSSFIKTQGNSWTKVTGIQMVCSYMNPGLHTRTLLIKIWPLNRTDFSECI